MTLPGADTARAVRAAQAELGLPDGTVKSRLNRALGRLRVRLEEGP